jgi:formylglycine-generating enzyme required for sulfatase activity
MMKDVLQDFRDEPRRPVDNITWEQATNFCHVLSERERTKLPPGYEFRLPTEAEWEYACRAGTTTMFSFGDDTNKLGEYAWYQKNSKGATHLVGEKKPNTWGVYDMHGNVMEWCLDWYQTNLPGGSVTNWFGPQKGTDRVLRGGGFANADPSNFRCADRWHQPPTAKGNGYGFRIVLAPTVEWLKKHQ